MIGADLDSAVREASRLFPRATGGPIQDGHTAERVHTMNKTHNQNPFAGMEGEEASENRIKELKIGFGMERMPSGDTKANGIFFRTGVIAHNLFLLF